MDSGQLNGRKELVIKLTKQVGYDFSELWYKIGTIMDVIDYDDLYYKKLIQWKREPSHVFIEKSFCEILPDKFIWSNRMVNT